MTGRKTNTQKELFFCNEQAKKKETDRASRIIKSYK